MENLLRNRLEQAEERSTDCDELVNAWRHHVWLENSRAATVKLLYDNDHSIREMAKEEERAINAELNALCLRLKQLLMPKDSDDERGVFLEVRAGTGGDEAAMFARDLFNMYSRYAETRGWRIEILSTSHGEHGGFKEVIALVKGSGVYGRLKFESGTHRVQRVPATESQGRIHTSACTVAIMAEQIGEIGGEINQADLRIDTYRSSGAGGQHVNTTDSAIRITHLPSGTVVECQNERSQHKNRAKAMSLLLARIRQSKDSVRHQAQANTRRLLIGSGDRSERIRTYNFPKGRLTDHRINLTLYQLTDVIAGQLDQVIDPLIQAQGLIVDTLI